MSNKFAICQVADQGPLESLVIMLRAAGYTPAIPTTALKNELRSIGCDTVLDIHRLVTEMGYEEPFALPVAGLGDMHADNIFVDVKAQKNLSKVTSRWPAMKNRVLWYRINGGKPEHVIDKRGDHGNEAAPGCPILTPNMWYALEQLREDKGSYEMMSLGSDGSIIEHGEQPIVENSTAPWSGNAYACWPPFYRFNEYATDRASGIGNGNHYRSPICLIHGIAGWGYGNLVDGIRKLGVMCHGQNAPDGLIQHREVRVRLTNALCMVHLKSSDAPGYALYEALAAACPIVCTRKLIWKNRMQDLLIPGKTCLVIEDGADHNHVSDTSDFLAQLALHLERLREPSVNKQIGEAGRTRLRMIQWNEQRNGKSFKEFMERHYGK